jgi:hypothetical protein
MSAFLMSFEAFEIQMLFALEFVGAVGIADGHGQRIAAGFLDEFDGFLRVGVMAAGGMRAAFLAFVELRADQMAQFGFDDAIVFVGVFHDFRVISTFFSNGSWLASIITLVKPSSMHSLHSSKCRRGPDGRRWGCWTG